MFSKEAYKLTRADFIFKMYGNGILFAWKHTCSVDVRERASGILSQTERILKPIELRTCACARAQTSAMTTIIHCLFPLFHVKFVWNFDWNRCASIYYLNNIFFSWPYAPNA